MTCGIAENKSTKILQSNTTSVRRPAWAGTPSYVKVRALFPVPSDFAGMELNDSCSLIITIVYIVVFVVESQGRSCWVAFATGRRGVKHMREKNAEDDGARGGAPVKCTKDGQAVVAVPISQWLQKGLKSGVVVDWA